MKTDRMCAALVLLLCSATYSPGAYAQGSAPSPAERRELDESFNTLFQAMKDGDVAVIEQYFSGQMSAEYKKLLEENRGYPDFLRNFYKGATFTIANVTPAADGEVVVDVAIQLGGGSKSVTRLQAKRFDGTPAKWKVAAVVKDGRTITPKK